MSELYKNLVEPRSYSIYLSACLLIYLLTKYRIHLQAAGDTVVVMSAHWKGPGCVFSIDAEQVPARLLVPAAGASHPGTPLHRHTDRLLLRTLVHTGRQSWVIC